MDASDYNESELPPLPVQDGVEFRHIPGFFGYIAGSDGSVWSSLIPNKKRRLYGQWHRKSTWPNADGYLFVALRGDDGKEHRPFVHSVILLAFKGPAPPGHEACHFPDPSPINNSIGNIRWGTRKQNMDDARKHGTLPRRERNGQAKLDELKAAAIRSLLVSGWTQKDIALVIGVSQPTVSAVSTGSRWQDGNAA